jgi:hypothetical protein
MKLYTVVVHNLQMCMKEYCCFLKFRRGDNSTSTIFLHAHLQVVYYNCVKFHKTSISRLGGVAFTRYTTPLMKEYGCCPKFKRGDNSTYTFTKRRVVYLVSATPPKRLIEVLLNFPLLNFGQQPYSFMHICR